MGLVAAVVKHAVTSAAFNHVGNSIARSICRLFQVFTVEGDHLVSERRKYEDHPADKTESEFETQVD